MPPRAAFALAIALIAGCYDLPKPQCGFRCGPDDACPDDYTCNATIGRCQLRTAPSTLQCEPAIDARLPDSPDMTDAPTDAAPDAPPDAPLPPDAPPPPIDAPPDAAPIDAPPDAAV